MDAKGDHVVEEPEGWFNVVEGSFSAPGAKISKVMFFLYRYCSILMPGDCPVCFRRFVEGDNADRFCFFADQFFCEAVGFIEVIDCFQKVRSED